MIEHHSYKPDIANWSDINYGEVLVCFDKDKQIKLKTTNNNVVIAGDSPRTLKNFSIFQYDSLSEGSFLRFRFKNNQLKLRTEVPIIYIKDIQGINIDDTYNTSDGYLAVTSGGEIINVPRKEYAVNELLDVYGGAYPANYVISYETGKWTYRPETSRLSAFDDVIDIAQNKAYRVLVSFSLPTSQGGFGENLHILDFSIVWDTAPVLGGNLECNGFNINHLPFQQKYIALTTSASTVSVNVDFEDGIVIECNNVVNYLSLQFTTSYLYASKNTGKLIKMYSVTLNNFKGFLKFESSISIISFENGTPPVIEGGTTMLNVFLYNEDDKIYITIIQKVNNAKKFTNIPI